MQVAIGFSHGFRFRDRNSVKRHGERVGEMKKYLASPDTEKVVEIIAKPLMIHSSGKQEGG